MALGPGKYDNACTQVREQFDAQGVILIVIGGSKGNGFSVQGTMRVLATLPDTLEHMAREMRKDAPHG